MAAPDWLPPPKSRRNEDALFEITRPAPLSARLRSAGRRDPDPGRHPQWLHCIGHSENRRRSINPSGVRGASINQPICATKPSYAHELADTADELYQRQKDKWIAYVETGTDGETHRRGRPLVSRPVLLMYGLSIENLIKGLLISETPALLNGGKLDKFLLSHDLNKLADKLSTITLSKEDKLLLSQLSDAVPYYGRYPVPRRWQDIDEEKYISEKTYFQCRTLFKALEMQLYRLNIRGINAPEGVRFANLRLTHLDEFADFVTDDDRAHTKAFLKDVQSSNKGANE